MPTTTFARKAVQRSCAAFLLGLVLCGLGSVAGSPAYAQEPPAVPADAPQVTPPASDDSAPANPPAVAPPAPAAEGNTNAKGNENAGGKAKDNTWDLKTDWLALLIVAGIALVVLIGTAVMLNFSRKPAQAAAISDLSVAFFFWLGLCYATVLLLLAVAYHFAWNGPLPFLLAGMLPIGVPWFGALGAVTISLAGVFFYGEAKWNKNFNYWHIGRPVFGAVLGVVAFFIFVLIVSTAGTPPPFLLGACKPDGTHCQPNDFIIYYVLAFLVGYREETFRELISRVTDLILKPNQAAGGVAAIVFKDENGAEITKLNFPNVAATVANTRKIQIANTGKAALKEAIVDLKLAGASNHLAFKNTDPFATNKELPAGQSVTMDITFTPPAAGNYEAVLSVAGKDMSPAVLSLTGTSP